MDWFLWVLALEGQTWSTYALTVPSPAQSHSFGSYWPGSTTAQHSHEGAACWTVSVIGYLPNKGMERQKKRMNERLKEREKMNMFGAYKMTQREREVKSIKDNAVTDCICLPSNWLRRHTNPLFIIKHYSLPLTWLFMTFNRLYIAGF